MSKLIALSPTTHANKKFLPRDRYHFTKEKSFAPILLAEISHLIPHYPLAFLPEGEKFVAVALLGTAQKNLYVNHEGMWLGSYVPSVFRAYPFAIAQDAQSAQSVFCLHEEALSDDEGALALFDEDGTLSAHAKGHLEFLQQCQTNKVQTQKAVDALAEAGLLVPWELAIKNEEEKPLVLQGLYRVDEAALNALDASALERLRNSSGLALAYAQLFSMLQHQQLSQRLKYHAQNTPKEVDIDALFGGEEEEILRF